MTNMPPLREIAHPTQKVKQSRGRLNAHHHSQGGFHNIDKRAERHSSIIPVLIRHLFDKKADKRPQQAIPVEIISKVQLNNLKEDSIIRLGHSSLFMLLNGQKWLIDPVFSDRASPVRFIGPKRFHQPPISLNELPTLDGVLISHDHYDHLDKASIKGLINKVKYFVVPLGVEKHLMRWKVPVSAIVTLDWWQSITFNDVTFTATPAQHFSGRGLWDRNDTLWASYVMKTPERSLFFSGDSGYFDGFKAIGDCFGPFDLTMIENGAYDKQWPTNHMTPEQSLQAHIDLKGEVMMPIHNGTFDLAFHPWNEPFKRIADLTEQANIPLFTPIMGQVTPLTHLPSTHGWWDQLNDGGNTSNILGDDR